MVVGLLGCACFAVCVMSCLVNAWCRGEVLSIVS